ncbi:MAG TPA: lysylphosphatidylglycerol synthase transmembrane domain-containing protein [Saprospiraceae bacterium]|nr:lysylphosphatidylglycerol synthase transmembrane domain-containing protein [Saprospiraceae bacterium]HMP13262.1 lysylphosphatidylglycerol synthase transmembrane domain-containing protein [Saprospiraceae bacterium]
MKQQKYGTFTSEQQDVLRSIRTSRILLPVLLGVGAVSYLLWRQFDPVEFAAISWTTHTYLWMGIAVFLFVLWHLMYSLRLYVLSNGAFGWWKCIELIFIWEFASAVSPSAVGGSTVAFFILAQEKLPVAKTTMIVLYTIMLDGFFFIFTIPILYLLFGGTIMRPDAANIADTGGWAFYFVTAYAVMTTYSLFFYYGIFVNPGQLKRILAFFTRLPILRRYHKSAIKLGNDMIVASAELKAQRFGLHFTAALSTFIIWTLRFLILNACIVAFVDTIPLDFSTQFELYARLEMMFLIFLFSPTPGGTGIIELLFGGFLSDYIVSPTLATVVSLFWRLLTYYFYLLAGVIIIPNWIRKILNERRRQRESAVSQRS